MKRSYRVRDYLSNPVVLISLFLRVASAIYILFNPVLGFILYLFFDFWDGYFFEQVEGLVEMPRPTYQRFDKYQDWLGYLFMVLVSLNSGYFPLMLALVFYRLLGTILFFLTRKQAIFVLFPNFIEPAFLWFILFPMAGVRALPWVFILLIIVSEIREIFLHIYWPWTLKKNGFPLFLRKYFGVRKEAIW